MPTTFIYQYVNISIRHTLAKIVSVMNLLNRLYKYEHFLFLKVLEECAFTIIAVMKYEIWAAKSRE